MIRKIIAVIAATYLICYAYRARSLWLADLEKQSKIGQDVLQLKNIDLSKEGTIVWDVPIEKWGGANADCDLSLEYENLHDDFRLERDGKSLDIKVVAKGILDNGQICDRLIRNWYCATDQPFKGDPHIWQSVGHDSCEYGLSSIRVFPFEKLKIEIQVILPNKDIQKHKPCLNFVRHHDSAIYHHLKLLRGLRDSAFVIALLATLTLVLLSIYPKKHLQNSNPI